MAVNSLASNIGEIKKMSEFVYGHNVEGSMQCGHDFPVALWGIKIDDYVWIKIKRFRAALLCFS